MPPRANAKRPAIEKRGKHGGGERMNAKERGGGTTKRRTMGENHYERLSKTTVISEGQSASTKEARVIYVQHGFGRRLIRRTSWRL